MEAQKFSWMIFLLIVFVAYIWGLLWQALMQKVWGGKIIKEISNSQSLYLKTKEGEYRLDSRSKRFNFKLRRNKAWKTVDFAEIKDIHIFISTDTASLIEFFVGDWGLWDLAGKYRDLMHTYSIQVLLQGGENVPILVLKQYEQREMWLGHLYLKMTIGILKMFKLYREGEDVAGDALESIAEKFRAAGFDITVRG